MNTPMFIAGLFIEMKMWKQLNAHQCIHAKPLQLCLSLRDPMDCSLPGSSVHGILQARTQEWVAMPSFRGSSQLGDQTCVSCTVGGFFTAEPQGKSKCPLIDKWIKTMCLYMQWNDKQPFIKQKIILRYVPTWMNLEDIMLSEISLSQKDKG